MVRLRDRRHQAPLLHPPMSPLASPKRRGLASVTELIELSCGVLLRRHPPQAGCSSGLESCLAPGTPCEPGTDHCDGCLLKETESNGQIERRMHALLGGEKDEWGDICRYVVRRTSGAHVAVA